MEIQVHSVLVVYYCVVIAAAMLISPSNGRSKSAVGDGGMKRDGLRVAFEAWNFCNEVGQEAPDMGSPRAADCFDVSSSTATTAAAAAVPRLLRSGNRKSQSSHVLRQHPNSSKRSNASSLIKHGGGGGGGDDDGVELQHKVSDADNKLGVGTSFPGLHPDALNNPDLYAAEKEVYLGSLCEVNDTSSNTNTPWQFWMVMLKNGNFDTTAGLCPENGKKVRPFPPSGKRFPCFGPGCMNQPVFKHKKTRLVGNGTMMRGGFYGTYDLGHHTAGGDGDGNEEGDLSYYEVIWEKKVGEDSSWVFKHKLKTSEKYPWLMLYLRADATSGFSGGYHYDTRGMLKTLPESPNFKVRLHLDVKQGGGSKNQFYLIDMGSCWKNNGNPCDGDVLTDVTRYSEMIINPETRAWCNKTNLRACPPYHIAPNDTKIYRSDTAHFPYDAYHVYCGPGNAIYSDNTDACDPYSNPQAQEIVQLLPHPVWAEYGFPTSRGQGWVGDPRTWELDVGGLSSRLYFYQDPGTPPARRVWTSLDMGTEIYVSDKVEVAEWSVSDFDVIITK